MLTDGHAAVENNTKAHLRQNWSRSNILDNLATLQENKNVQAHSSFALL